VVDVDTCSKGGDVTITRLCAAHGGIPATHRVTTPSGGFHLYFQYDERLPDGTERLGKGVDVKSDGGMVVAPPSVNDLGAYRCANETVPVLPLPEWLRPVNQREEEPQKEKRHRKYTLAEITDALNHVDPDQRDAWLNMGIVLGREFNRAPEAWDVYLEWAGRSEKFNEDRAGNLERMREKFEEDSAAAPRAGGRELSLGSLIKLAKDGGWEPPEAERDADHYRLALALIDGIERETGRRPVYSGGALWIVREAIWCERSLDDVVMDVAKKFAAGKYCKRGGDFASIARVAAQACTDEHFFEEAAVGIAAPCGFWCVTETGEIRHEPLTAAHRQRLFGTYGRTVAPRAREPATIGNSQ
jgi:hypothetical protein